jgi:hypothetical protein
LFDGTDLLMLDELFCECPATGQLLGDTIFLATAAA